MIRFCTNTNMTGYAEMGRSVISQLLAAGQEVAVQPIITEPSSTDLGPRSKIAQLFDKSVKVDVNIVNTIPPLFSKHSLGSKVKNIGFTTFEANSIPKDWVGQCNRMDAIWVTSQWNARVFAESGVTVPIHTITADANISAAMSAPSEKNPFTFFSSFQWSVRKNPQALIRAFCSAFDGEKNVRLIIKTHKNFRQTDSIESEVNRILADIKSTVRPTIKIITEMLDKSKLDQLHVMADCFVSLSHAEGWGIPAWQASTIGCPVIHTNYSAPKEYLMHDGRVNFNMTPIYGMQSFVPFFDANMMWAEPHLDHAIELMRSIYYDSAVRSEWKEDAAKHAGVLRNMFSEESLVKRIKEAL